MNRAALGARENRIVQEYVLIDEIARHAADAKVMRACKILRESTLPQLRDYSKRLVTEVPSLALSIATQVGHANGAEIKLYQNPPQLPVQIDPLATADDLSVIPHDWYGTRKTTEYYPRPPDVPEVPINRRQIVKVTQLCAQRFPGSITIASQSSNT